MEIGNLDLEIYKLMFLFKKTFIILFVSLGILSSVSVFAADSYGLVSAGEKAGLSKLTISNQSIPQFAGEVVGTGLSLIGIVFFLLMLYAGIRWMIAMGKSEDVQKAKDILEAAAIGLVIVLSAYAITQFVFTNLVGGGSSTEEMGPPAPENLNPDSGNLIWCLLPDKSNCIQGPAGAGCASEHATEAECRVVDVPCFVPVSRSCEMTPLKDCGQTFTSLNSCTTWMNAGNVYASCNECCVAKCDAMGAGGQDTADCYEECQFCNTPNSAKFRNSFDQCNASCNGVSDRQDRTKCKN